LFLKTKPVRLIDDEKSSAAVRQNVDALGGSSRLQRSKAALEFLWFSDSYGSRSKLTDSRSLINVGLLQHGRTG
jgi:hypothetical protein